MNDDDFKDDLSEDEEKELNLPLDDEDLLGDDDAILDDDDLPFGEDEEEGLDDY